MTVDESSENRGEKAARRQIHPQKIEEKRLENQLPVSENRGEKAVDEVIDLRK